VTFDLKTKELRKNKGGKIRDRHLILEIFIIS